MSDEVIVANALTGWDYGGRDIGLVGVARRLSRRLVAVGRLVLPQLLDCMIRYDMVKGKIPSGHESGQGLRQRPSSWSSLLSV